jgi:tRNA U34 5-methylaminomethyl-2-thiouridine-forming methyltransferase MnmC
MNDKVHLKITGDGSHTLFVPELNENYHSYHGAYAEAVHVFIETGLRSAFDSFEKVNIFEVGFGTGLNATLAYQFASHHSKPVSYTGIEKYPLDKSIVDQLNYKEFWKQAELDVTFDQMHSVTWNEACLMHPFFTFKKLNGAVQDYTFEPNYYHLIFFDAFAPEKQPDMWTVDLFKQLYGCLQTKGALVTYCAKGQFKRDLKAAGFEVETLPGPPGKREMVRGVKL